MLHTVGCPQCQMDFSIATEHVGSRFRCPQCSCLFTTKVVHGGYIQSVVEYPSPKNYFPQQMPPEIETQQYHAPAEYSYQKYDHREDNNLYSHSSSSKPYEHQTSQWSNSAFNYEARSLGPPLHLSEEDSAEIASVLKIPPMEMRSRTANKDSANRFTISETKKMIHFLREKYQASQGLELTGNKTTLLERIFKFVDSDHYRYGVVTASAVRDVPDNREKLGPSNTNSLSSSPYYSEQEQERVLIDVSCPGCGADHQVDGRVIVKSPGTHYACPDCGALFSVSLPQEGQVVVQLGLNYMAPDVNPSIGQSSNTVGNKENHGLNTTEDREEYELPLYPKGIKTESLASMTMVMKFKEYEAATCGQQQEARLVQALASMGYSTDTATTAARLCGGTLPRAVLTAVDVQGGEMNKFKQQVSMEDDDKVIKTRDEVDVAVNQLIYADRAVAVKTFPNSFLLNRTKGCDPLRQTFDTLSTPSLTKDYTRSSLWALVVRLLLLEKQLLHLFVDVGRCFMKTVSKRIEKGVDKLNKSQSPKLNADKEPFALPAPLLQHEVSTLEQILFCSETLQGKIPAPLLSGYVTRGWR